MKPKENTLTLTATQLPTTTRSCSLHASQPPQRTANQHHKADSPEDLPPPPEKPTAREDHQTPVTASQAVRPRTVQNPGEKTSGDMQASPPKAAENDLAIRHTNWRPQQKIRRSITTTENRGPVAEEAADEDARREAEEESDEQQLEKRVREPTENMEKSAVEKAPP